MDKMTKKTVILPVKYRKDKRFYKEDIKSIEKTMDMFSKKAETLIVTNGDNEYYIDLPYDKVISKVKEE